MRLHDPLGVRPIFDIGDTLGTLFGHSGPWGPSFCRVEIHMYRFLLFRPGPAVPKQTWFWSMHVVGFFLFSRRFESHVSDSCVFMQMCLMHVSFSSVFNTCVRGDVFTLSLVNTRTVFLWLGVKQPVTQPLCRHCGGLGRRLNSFLKWGRDVQRLDGRKRAFQKRTRACRNGRFKNTSVSKWFLDLF